MDAKIALNNMLVLIAHDQPATLGVLSSRVHALWRWRQAALGRSPALQQNPLLKPFPFPC